MPDPTFFAWLAGLFEGEGSIIFRAKNSVELVLGMVDEDVVDRVERGAGCGNRWTQDRDDRSKTMFWWSVSRKSDVERLLREMLPYFGERRSQRATEALLRLENCRPVGTKDVCGRG